MVVVSLYNLVNTFWVARLGYQAVAAITVVLPFSIFAMAVAVGTGIGVNALSSRRFGEHNPEASNKATGQSFFLSVVIGLVFLVLTNVFPRQILDLCGATPDIMEMGEQYLRIFGLGMPLFLFSIIGRNIFHASGDTFRPMVFNVTAQLLNAALDPFLIFGWGFFPEMGVRGAALATAISSNIGALIYLWFILRGKTAYRIRFHHCIPDIRIIKDIYRVGFPSMLMEMTESVVFAIMNNVASGFGSVTLAAVGIAGRISDLAFMPILGAAHGLLPIVGFSLGAKLWDRLWRAVKLTTTWLGIFLAAATILLEIFTPQVVRVFNSDPELVAIAVPGMRIFCSTMMLIGMVIIFVTTFQGLSKGRDAMVLSLTRQFVFFVPGIFLFSYWLGMTGLWLSMPVSDFLGFVVASIWLFREYRLQKRKNFPEKTASAAENTG